MPGTAALLVLLAGPSGTAPPESANVLAVLREDARAAARPWGLCYDAAQKSAMPLDGSKLGCMDQPFEDLTVPEADRARVTRHLAAEWARRAAPSPDVGDRERAP